MTDCSVIVKSMAKKGTFIEATSQLAEMIKSRYAESDSAGKEEIFAACKRAFSLLRSRYTAVGFWRAGKVLADAAMCAMESDAAKAGAVREWLSLAAIEISAGDAASGVDQPAVQDPNNPSEQQAQSGRAGAPGNPGEAGASATPMENLARDLGFEAFLNSVIGEMGIEELLSRVAVGGEADVMDSSTPAASREARFNLDVKTIREQGAVCLVCQEDFKPKSKAKVMPCGHPFHFDCLMEWLERNNTCPTCRHALPTERPTFDLESDLVSARDPTTTSLYI